MAPQAIIIGGPNGSGKSTFADEYLTEHRLHYLCTDAIAAALNPDRPDRSKVTAGKTFLRRFHESVSRREDVMIESTLAGLTMTALIASLKRQGYDITIIYLFLESPAVCIHRVHQRVLRGGHYVPDEDIVRRFYRSKRNFWHRYRHAVDRWYIYHNTEDRFEEVAMGIGAESHQVDEVLLDRFLKLADHDGA